MLAASIVFMVVVGLIAWPEIFPDGNKLVDLASYNELRQQVRKQKRLSVDEVEAILGPAARITAKTPGLSECRFYVGPRDRGSRRSRVIIGFANGRTTSTQYECNYEPTFPAWIMDKMVSWFWRLFP